MSTARVSMGVAGTLGPDAIAKIAVAAERAGLYALWVNDTPGGDSLAALRAASAVTDRLVLATGVIPFDRYSADDIAAGATGLAAGRLVLGVGSGQLAGPVLSRVGDGVAQLKARTGARVVVGALGPKMRRLAAASADGPLLSWLTPQIAAAQADEAHGVSPAAHVALYIRAALEDEGMPRLVAETGRYAALPKYAANFARLRIAASDTVITPADAAVVVPAYRAAVDEIVLRAVTGADDVGAYLRFAEQAGEFEVG
ncbi:LLM class F420-dependent oxidoreductase [Microbacterium kribbense]|uniref:LLM class F420-dependent oxidoreductase n=1 Tax=Microbacterium kribbense TaxID=433645 RepID=A0ABP7GKB5_9MICO